MQLFENMYHAGAHQLVGGRLRHRSSGAQPIAVHFNGPAKVSTHATWLGLGLGLWLGLGIGLGVWVRDRVRGLGWG